MLDLTGLNEPQRVAVMHREGPLLVLAGAGSGKTRVIIYRIAQLLAEGVPAARILGVTFTNKAAHQMRERLRSLCGRLSAAVQLSTFHALGLAILTEEYAAANLTAGFCVYNTADQLSLVRELTRQVKVADRRLDAQRLLAIILKTKKQRLPEVALDWGDDYEMAAFDLFPKYMAQMQAFNAIDFDDLILRSQDALQHHDVRQRWANRYDHLLIDEYQDTSPDQLQLIDVLAGTNQNICAVGDDDQAIYAWRGAALDNILSFSQHFKKAREIILDQNYRSTPRILAAANAVIAGNKQRKDKRLWSTLAVGEPVSVVACEHDEDEANFVTEAIESLHAKGVPYTEMAVLYRSNLQSRIFEEALTLARIPFCVVGGQAFFDRKEVRDALAFLAVLHNHHDDMALRRIINVPSRGIGVTSLEHLVAFAKAQQISLWQALLQAHQVPHLSASAKVGIRDLVQILEPAGIALRQAKAPQMVDLVEKLLTSLGLAAAIDQADDPPKVKTQRLDNLLQVQKSLERYVQRDPPPKAPLAEFLRAASLVRDNGNEAATELDEMTLMTLHSAKGLEFRYVFLVGVEEELLPHKRTLDLGGEISEERRLCYVGITRAKEQLWMTFARKRLQHGRLVDRTPSRFLESLPNDDCVQRVDRSQAVIGNGESPDLAAAFFAKMRSSLGY